MIYKYLMVMMILMTTIVVIYFFFFSHHKGGKPTGFIAGEQQQARGRIFEGWSPAFSKFVYEGFSKICPHSWNVFVPTQRLGL